MKKKLLTILLSVFMLVGAFTANVFASGISNIGDVLATNQDFPTSKTDAWTADNGNTLYINSNNLAIDNGNDSLTVGLDTVVSSSGGIYTYNNAQLSLTFNLEDNVLSSITVVYETNDSYNGTYSKQIKIADILPNDFPNTADVGWCDENGNTMYINNGKLCAKIGNDSTQIIDLNTRVDQYAGFYGYDFANGGSLNFYLNDSGLYCISCNLNSTSYGFNRDNLLVGGIVYQITSLNPNTVKVHHYTSNIQPTITIPETFEYNSKSYSVTSIDYGAFAYSNITGITIPNTITSIYSTAFNSSANLSNVIVKATTPPELIKDSLGNSFHFFGCNENLKIIVPLASYEKYTNEDSSISKGWPEYKEKIEAFYTVADVLAKSAKTFPTTIESGWVSQDGSKTYINGNNLQFGDVLPLNSILTPSGNDYEIIKGDNTFTFVMESGVLSRITTMLQGLSSTVSYYPYTYTNPSISVQAGNTDIEFVTNAVYINDSDVTVKVDGNTLTLNTHYTLAHGSTHVTLKGSYISTLSAGPHTITIGVTGYSDINQGFTITAAPSPSSDPTPRYKVPNTGVEGTYSNNHSLLKLSSLSLLAIGTYMVLKKKKDN